VWDPRYEEPRVRARDLGLGERVRFLGPVPDPDLPTLYSAARVFAFPSLYEGFGLPVLEAMRCGVPVVTSASSSLPEVVADAGLTVDPTDVAAIADALARVLDDGALHDDLSRRAVARAAEFTWHRAAAAHRALYRRLLSR
jgi:glycosyltransferase involved in cell wall biosynthesis